MVRYLSLDDLLDLCTVLEVGPVRDLGLLESAARRPQAQLWGCDCYPEFAQKVAALLESLVRNHALVDGNKRLGWLATVVMCDINGWVLEVPDDEAYDLVIMIASGQATLSEITEFIQAGISQAHPE